MERIGDGWYGTESEWHSDRPDPSGSLRRWEMASLRARDGLEIVGSCRDITADLTRTYSGRCIEVNGTGLGERAIESLWRIQLSVRIEWFMVYRRDGGLMMRH